MFAELMQTGVEANFVVLAPATGLFALAIAALVVRRAAARRDERADLPPAR